MRNMQTTEPQVGSRQRQCEREDKRENRLRKIQDRITTATIGWFFACGAKRRLNVTMRSLAVSLSFRRKPRSTGAQLALVCAIAAAAMPYTAAQYCPYLITPGEVYGMEDTPLRMQHAWINSPTTLEADRAIAGRLWHGHCPSTVCGTCLGSEVPMPGQYLAANNQIRVEYSVLYGRLFLDEGYLNCNLVVDAANFDVISEREARSFFITGTYEVVNCTLQYLTFQGLRFANKMLQLAHFGKQPRITVSVAPPRTGGPTQDGLQYIYAISSSTFVVMEELNTLPSLETCPTMGIENDSPKTIRYKEQYEPSLQSSTTCQTCLPNLLHWDPASGGSRCLQTRLPGANRFLYPAPEPNFYQPPIRNNAGVKTGLGSPIRGAAVAPMKIQPSFCQSDDVRINDPPYCDALKAAGHQACAADPLSYVYHIEDYEDATLRINGIRMWDKDLWTGYVDTTFSFRFKPEGPISGKMNDPFDHEVDNDGINIEGSGSFLSFCAQPYYDRGKRAIQLDSIQLDSQGAPWNKHCARTVHESISQIVLLDKEQTRFYVLPQADRTAATPFDQTNCEMVKCEESAGCDPSSEAQLFENKWSCSSVSNSVGSTLCMVHPGVTGKNLCARTTDGKCVCKSQVYSSNVVQGRKSWNTILFWEMADRDNRSMVFESGYMMLTYTNSSITSGAMWADPQTLPYVDHADGKGLPFDWFRASPLKLKGKLTALDSVVFYVDASTQKIINPVFTMTLNVLYGNVSLPNSPIAPVEQNRTFIKIVGTITQLNEALSVVEYRVPGYIMPHFNTLSATHSIYGPVEERLFLTMDDGGNTGVLSKWGTATTMEFNLLVVADNDAPFVSGPASFSGSENLWFPLHELSVLDLDAVDRLTPNETMTGHGRVAVTELQLQLSSSFGVFRIDTNGTKEVRLLNPVPGSVRPFPGDVEPCVDECGEEKILSSYEQFAALSSSACKNCLENFAKARIAQVGFRRILFEGDLRECKRALGRSWYKGNPGFSKNTPASGDPFTAMGKQTDSFGANKAQEHIIVTAMDLGNTGCTSSNAKEHIFRSPVILESVESDPFMIFLQEGEDMCILCKITGLCDVYCPGGVPKVYSWESTSLSFNESFSAQIRDFDTRDTNFQPASYTLRIKVDQGILLLPDTVIIDGKSEVAAGLTYSAGTEGCKQCSEFELSGSMYDLNKALIGIQYVPIKFYNSQFGARERLSFQLTQIAPLRSLSTFKFEVEIFVQGINDVPVVNLFTGSTQPSTQLAVSGTFHDFILLGGPSDRSEFCNRDAVSCFTMRDPDSCESMYLKSGTLPNPSDTLLVQNGIAPVCQRTDIPAGQIRMTAKCNYGNLWFFTPSEISRWEATQGNQWPPDLSLAPPKDPGKEERTFIVDQPLSQYVGGILRFYPSIDSSQPDSITLEFDDHGNTGRALDGEPIFCCCSNAACDSCKQGACMYEIEVTSCAKVPGWVCKDVEGAGRPLPGWGVTVIVGLVGSIMTAGIGYVVYQGHLTNAIAQPFRTREAVKDKTSVTISTWVHTPTSHDGNPDPEVTLAVAV